MRRQLILLLVIVSFVGISASTFGQAEADSKLEEQVGQLSNEVAQLRDDLEHSQAQIDQVLAFIQTNQRAAAEMARALADSETAGFTYGINPKSRELLLAGWRKQLDAMQKNVPGASTQPAAESDQAVGTRVPR